ncbi:securin isoform X1 [Manis pentadactyla]|uniref:securin isoform X1 n=1 Tax=Manis pentadactyla TaxID=143292 RepID=UPI0018744A7C|nr:securin isoform X1 [Manis pentadactyla]XP_036775075.1 securin isoform X1 [Manis pentadactyla]XP_036775145.1 securin isoform X1 [Manis pentadactyla]XP_057347344.1 securin isoform X1 [Manis pentadactyla]XP_057347349.1 securin isoform X1 [Manis pentadactyla]XP_057347352.1 securin isoform X1 [Manis pentadactyla]KAI5235051.1 Securin [Manis pentadactyla]
MATLIFIDKENGEPGTRVALKDGKLGSGSSVKALDGRSQVSTPRVGKMFDAPPALPKTARKALGTVNRATEKSVKTNGPLKQKQTTFSAKKVAEKTVKAKDSFPASEDTYPEIEKFFPFNPLDFESFDLPEEHQIAHLPLNGVPLMILDEEQEIEKLLHLGPPSPLKMPSLPWESNPLSSPSILSTLDVELPPLCYDLDI